VNKSAASVSDLFALVLTGGRGRRFGGDKAAIRVDGTDLLARTCAALESIVASVFVSVRPDQSADALRHGYSLICDEAPGLGPAAGLMAAYRYRSDVAWLVTACDMPGLDEATLRILVESRDADRAATAFVSPTDGKPEPLCAIYEPDTLARFSQQATEGRGLSPRDLLADSDVKYVKLSDATALTNVNTPEDLEAWHALRSERH
jgi:molybdopterin-guanine dinucleotide biosynthesis protein A